jgi:tRNA pseudouridine13 synthase
MTTSVTNAPKPRARIKVVPEDFVVEEIPAYAPSGDGEHVYVRFTKRGLTTDAAVRAIAAAAGANARDAGVAGMKDKHAVTTQTISLLVPRGVSGDALIDRLNAASLDAITIHEAKRHGNKLKPGHLAGNRFTLRVRSIPRADIARVVADLERVAREGMPNAYGAQRFGRAGDNAERARAWLSGAWPAPRDPRLRRLLFSALQSAIFNAVLDARIQDGTWAVPQKGDLLKRRSSGGLFLCADVQEDRRRAESGEVSPTGPMVGVKMRWPEDAPGELERGVSARFLGETFDLADTKNLGEGTRRALRLWVEDLRVSHGPFDDDGEQEASVRVYFVLPKGAYATTVLGAAVELEADDERSARVERDE